MDASTVLVEVGVGELGVAERPFARGMHVVGLDVDATLLTSSVGHPVVAADAVWLPFRDRSLGHLVARNVFGDVGLGHRFEDVTGFDPAGYRRHLDDLVRRGDRLELLRARDRVRAMSSSVDATRRSLMLEAARVLGPGGSVLIVETLTPGFAEKWLEHLCGCRLRAEGAFTIDRVQFRCRPIRSFAKRARYCTEAELTDRGLRVWVVDPRSSAAALDTGPKELKTHL